MKLTPFSSGCMARSREAAMEQLPAIITKARARLLVRAPFTGSIALGLAWVNAPEIGTMSTDGRSIWFNPAWCEAHGVEKTMGVIAHEVLHVVNRHHLRRGGRDAKLWNIAGDLLINRLLEDDKYVLPSDGLFDRDRRYAGLPTETIYARLLEQQQQQQDDQSGRQSTNSASAGNGSGTGTGSDATASGQGGSHDKADQEAAPKDNGVFPARHWGEVRDLTRPNGQRLSPTERRQAEHDLDVRIRQAAAAAKRAGKFGTALQQMVEIATDRVDWRDRFRIVFDGVLRGEVNWARPNRRFVQHGIYLPGWRRTGAGRIAFVLDTSGSISVDELSVYTGAVLGILEETGPEAVALIQCDAEVQRVDTIQPGESFDRIEVHGRGGTRFQPAFDWIAESGFGADAIVYATDLNSSDQPQDPGLPVIWLTPTRNRTMPFGEIVPVSV
jgi:predicted metal-dependent peptidase